jgi:hypothetical protein
MRMVSAAECSLLKIFSGRRPICSVCTSSLL